MSKFTVICNNCGSEDVFIEQDYDYDYDDNIVPTGNPYLRCSHCGESGDD